MVQKNKAGTLSLSGRSCAILLACIIALSTALTLAFYYGPSPINGSDNYIYQSTAQTIAAQGFAAIGQPGALGVKYILVSGIALFYKLMGVSPLSSVMFDLICGALLLVAIYLIGKELHGAFAGLLAALLFSFYPLFVVQSANGPGDNIPMMLFAATSILLYILGRKSGRGSFFAASGFVAAMGFLIVAETSLIALPVLLFIVWDALHGRKFAIRIPIFIGGIVLGLLVIASLSYLQNGNPLYVYHTDSNWYSGFCDNGGSCSQFGSTQSLNSYLTMIFPYGVVNQLFGPGALANLPGNLLGDLTSSSSAQDYGKMFGFYPYFAVAFFFVLLAFRDRRAAIPAVWAVSTLLYLSFGTMSISHFVSVEPIYPRVTLIFGPALALLIAFALADIASAASSISGKRASKLRKVAPYAAFAFVGIVVGFLFLQSVLSIRYINYAEYNYVYPLVSAGSYLNTLPTNAIIVGSMNYPVIEYTGGLNPFYADNGSACEGVPKGGYLYAMYNSSLQQQCNLTIVAGPFTKPSWLPDYPNYPTFGNVTNLVVYQSV